MKALKNYFVRIITVEATPVEGSIFLVGVFALSMILVFTLA